MQGDWLVFIVYYVKLLLVGCLEYMYNNMWIENKVEIIYKY